MRELDYGDLAAVRKADEILRQEAQAARDAQSQDGRQPSEHLVKCRPFNPDHGI